ncbi:MAG: hypothetical protein WAM65_00400, partial [Candidatus Korobacteraceae bacterium]
AKKRNMIPPASKQPSTALPKPFHPNSNQRSAIPSKSPGYVSQLGMRRCFMSQTAAVIAIASAIKRRIDSRPMARHEKQNSREKKGSKLYKADDPLAATRPSKSFFSRVLRVQVAPVVRPRWLYSLLPRPNKWLG